MKIMLIGFMGCGKTTVGKLLSKRLNIPFFDLDEIIVNRTKLSIPEIFKEMGEEKFRRIESLILKELLHQNKSFVLSTGGGTPVYPGNIEEIKRKSVSIFLKTDFRILWKRISFDKNRPLVSLGMDEVYKLYIKRFPYYLQADFTVDTSYLSPESTVSIIKKFINAKNKLKVKEVIRRL